MSNQKRKKLPQLNSPKGAFRFPHLVTPDMGNEKYPKKGGEYNVVLVLHGDDPATKAFIDELTRHHENARVEAEEKFAALSVGTRKKLEGEGITGPKMQRFFAPIYDQETEEPTGEVMFKFKALASGVNKKTGKKWSRKMVIVDAKGQRMTKVPDIWGGTVGKVAFEVSHYFVDGKAEAGISLRLMGVQVIDLVKGGERSAESLGFGEEDGYVYDPEDAAGEDYDGGSDDAPVDDNPDDDADF